MESATPLISVIVPTLNEEKRLPKCLESVVSQSYPRSKIEIIVVDDGSTDGTITIAKKFGAKIFMNGTHHIERGKSIGLKHARGEYVFFIDADNTLTSRQWFRAAIKIFAKHPRVTGIESWKYSYRKYDSLVNRYCALYGINDPLTLYLGKAGFVGATEKHWPHRDSLVREFDRYILTRFTPRSLSVIGSNGYMTKRALLLKTNWKPYLFHLDSAYDLVVQGHTTFARLKYDVGHDFASSVWDMLKKIKRNSDLFLRFRQLRRYTYTTSIFDKGRALLVMSTGIIPFLDAWKGYQTKRDVAWFLHPFMCLLVLFVDTLSLGQYFLTPHAKQAIHP